MRTELRIRHDPQFIAAFDAVFISIGLRGIKTPVRALGANAFAEHFVGTARRACRDHLLIFTTSGIYVAL